MPSLISLPRILKNTLPLVAIGLLLPLGLAKAVDLTWDSDTGTGGIQDGTGSWNTSNTNWDNAGANQSFATNDSAIFGAASGAAGTVTIDEGASIGVTNITFNAPGSGNYTIAAANSANDKIDFGTNTSTIALDASATISAPITKTGGGPLTITDGGGVSADDRLTLSADNSGLTTGITVSQGTKLQLDHSNAAGTSMITLIDSEAWLLLNNGVNVGNDVMMALTGADKEIRLVNGTGITAEYSGTLTINEQGNNNVFFSANGTGGNFDPTQVLTISGKITGNGLAANENIRIVGDGVVVLSNAANDFRGQLQVNGDGTVLRIAHAGAIPNATAGSSYTGRVVLNSTNSQLELADGVTTDSTNTLQVNSANNNKSLRIQPGATSATWGGNIENDEASTSRHFDLRADDDQTLTVEGVISGAGWINTINDGTIVLNGNNTFTGEAHIGDGGTSSWDGSSGNKNGFTVIGNSNALGQGKVVARGSQIQANTTGIDISNNIDVISGALRVGGNNDFELSGDISVVGSDRGFGNYGLEGLDVTLSGTINTTDGANERQINVQGSGGKDNGSWIITGAITGGGNLNVDDSFDLGDVKLSGANTYTGDTIVRTGTLTLEDAGQLYFDIEANGSNNAVLGAGDLTGTAIFDGTFFFDLATADTTDGNSWEIVEIADLAETFNATFDVTSTAGAFSPDGGGDFHSLTDGNNTWTFTESTGVLDLEVIPEPSSAALLAISGLALLRRRRK